jgi:hypothetical protein
LQHCSVRLPHKTFQLPTQTLQNAAPTVYLEQTETRVIKVLEAKKVTVEYEEKWVLLVHQELLDNRFDFLLLIIMYMYNKNIL